MSMLDPSGNNASPTQLAEQKAKDLAIASMAVSITLVFMSCGFLSFIGAIMGHTALTRLNALGVVSNRGFALAGIIIGWVATALCLIGLLIFGAFLTAAVTDTFST